MLKFELTDKLQKKARILGKKNKTLAMIFRKKLKEVISHTQNSISTYKNLKSPMNEFKRIHLTDNYILLFKIIDKKVIFIDILHWNKAYKRMKK